MERAPDLGARKALLRRALAARRRALTAEEARRAGEAVAERLAATPEFAACRRIALYADADGELPTAPLWRAARARRLPILWPRLVGGALEFARCDEAEELCEGRFGIRAPGAHCEGTALGAGDLVVVPAVALDRAGRRLGRGAGYYDRALAVPGAPASVRVGVGYDFQLLDRVPAGEGDEPVDLVITEHALVRTGARAVRA